MNTPHTVPTVNVAAFFAWESAQYQNHNAWRREQGLETLGFYAWRKAGCPCNKPTCTPRVSTSTAKN